MRGPTYVVLGNRPWSRAVFEQRLRTLPGRWVYVDRPSVLARAPLARWAPAYVFVLHWSWRLPATIVKRYACVGFHMTDLPYGRGGSPLQHLILRGHRRTKLSALRLTEAFDAGPIYGKADLSLAGSAEQIYNRAMGKAATMIRRIIAGHLTPRPQHGRVVVFRRRQPSQSRIPRVQRLEALNDFIRMLDAEGYPRAFVEHQGFRYEFSKAKRRNGVLVAEATILPKETLSS